MTDLTDHLIDRVRCLLKQHPPFAGMTRDDLDNEVLADLRRDIRHDLDSWIAEAEYEMQAEVDRRYDEIMTEKKLAKARARGKGRSA
jgi:hypothetical protein